MKLLSIIAGAASQCGARLTHVLFYPITSFGWRPSLGFGCILLAATLARAAEPRFRIELHDVGSNPMTAAQLAAFREAAGLWEGKFSDPITVIMNIAFEDLVAGVLGQTLPNIALHSYEDVRAALRANAENPREQGAIDDLPAGLSVPVNDINGARNDDRVSLSTANAKALGLGAGWDPRRGGEFPHDADGYIAFANAFANTFDYDRSDGIAAGFHDFVAVAAHEIGHVLGFLSVTDLQDWYPLIQFHPNTLDFWRFAETGRDHDLDAESRFITCGAAEYYDDVWLNLPFARGVLCPDDPCGTGRFGYQASHWRDCGRNALMDPTLAPGVRLDIHSDDTHALSYIGYEVSEGSLGRRDFPALQHVLLKWFCLTCPPRIPPHWTDPWPNAPGSPPPPAGANLAMVLALDMRLPGEQTNRLRSAVGFARFENARPNPYPTSPGLPPVAGQVQLFPAPPRAGTLPPTLTDFYFVSDRSNGVPFTAHALFSASGAQFNRSLGPFGGYRITLAIDGEGDGVMGDVDGLMTMVLLADARGVPDPSAQNEFQLASNLPDNGLQVVDALALGLCDAGAPRAELEPNNLPAAANNLGAPSFVTVLGAISPGNDVDYYRFTAPSNSKAWITVDTGGVMQPGANSRDCLVSLFDAANVLLETDGDDGSGNGGNSTLETGDASAIAGRTLVAGGAYYIRVAAAGAGLVIRPYRLFLTVTAGPIPAEVEPNNTFATANLLLPAGAISAVRTGRIAATNDVDYFAVLVPGRSILHISADGDPERNVIATDVIVDLLAPNGALQFSANSSAVGGLGNPPAEGYCFLAPGPGVARVRVRGAAGVTGTYNLMVAVCPLPLPRLSAERQGQAARLSWPADALGFTLQSSSDLRVWSNSTLPQNYGDDRIIVELPSGSSRQFFRLMSPE